MNAFFVLQLDADAVHELLTSPLAVHRNLFEVLSAFLCEGSRQRLVLSLKDSLLKFNRILHVHHDSLRVLGLLEDFVSHLKVLLLGDFRVNHKYLVVILLKKLARDHLKKLLVDKLCEKACCLLITLGFVHDVIIFKDDPFF